MQQDRKIWDKLALENKIIWEENCPFCKNKEGEEKLIIWKSDLWEVRYNKYPYWWIKNHILLIPKRHVEYSKDLTIEEFIWLKEAKTFIHNFYENKQYFSFLRETFLGRSIKHLHYHYMPGNIYSSDFESILNKQKIK